MPVITFKGELFKGLNESLNRMIRSTDQSKVLEFKASNIPFNKSFIVCELVALFKIIFKNSG